MTKKTKVISKKVAEVYIIDSMWQNGEVDINAVATINPDGTVAITYEEGKNNGQS